MNLKWQHFQIPGKISSFIDVEDFQICLHLEVFISMPYSIAGLQLTVKWWLAYVTDKHNFEGGQKRSQNQYETIWESGIV